MLLTGRRIVQIANDALAALQNVSETEEGAVPKEVGALTHTFVQICASRLIILLHNNHHHHLLLLLLRVCLHLLILLGLVLSL